MKILLGILLLAGAVAVAAPDSSTTAPVAPTAAAAPATTFQFAQTSQPQEGVCPFYWVCDEPYGQFQTLAQCRPTCSVQCGIVYTCNP